VTVTLGVTCVTGASPAVPGTSGAVASGAVVPGASGWVVGAVASGVVVPDASGWVVVVVVAG
jgi:hypothetical protein